MINHHGINAFDYLFGGIFSCNFNDGFRSNVVKNFHCLPAHLAHMPHLLKRQLPVMIYHNPKMRLPTPFKLRCTQWVKLVQLILRIMFIKWELIDEPYNYDSAYLPKEPRQPFHPTRVRWQRVKKKKKLLLRESH